MEEVIVDLSTGETKIVPVSEEEIAARKSIAEQAELEAQAAFDALPYTEKRAREYPPYTDYLDGIVKGDQSQVQAYIDECLAVKSKYPKTFGE